MLWLAAASGHASLRRALRVWATWRGYTRINWLPLYVRSGRSWYWNWSWSRNWIIRGNRSWSYNLAVVIRTAGVARRADALRSVVDHLTDCLISTDAWTRVATMLIEAGQAEGTFLVGGALGTAAGWTAIVTRQTTADGLLLHRTTMSICTTWRGLAGIDNNHWCLLWCLLAEHKWITLHAIGAVAYGYMLMHLTNGSIATGAWTRINAAIAYAGLVPGTFSAQHTLWTTTHIWIALVEWQATANAARALSIGTTRRWLTRIIGCRWRRRCWRSYRCRVATMEGISQVTTWAATAGHMVQHATLSIQATSTWTRVPTLLIQASTVCCTVRVDGTLRLAMRWCAIVFRQATADGLLIDHTTLGVGSTR